MQGSPLISICIPANGRIQFVRNTLKSIYNDENFSKVSLDDFEVVLSDNNSNSELECLLAEFPYRNFFYFNTHCEGFLNSYFVLTYANGKFLKLHNSQEIFRKNSLFDTIQFIKSCEQSKPCVFFSSGFLSNGKLRKYDRFDDFMFDLSYWSSWSNGFGIWKEDFDTIKNNIKVNSLFPHTSLFLTQYNKKVFIINDIPLFKTQFVEKRGGHNKFHAFSVEYPSLIQDSYEKEQISLKTKKKILNDILVTYLPVLYFNVKISKRETFESNGFKKNIKVYFPKGSYWVVLACSLFVPFKVIWRKIKINYLLKSKY